MKITWDMKTSFWSPGLNWNWRKWSKRKWSKFDLAY